MGMVDSNTTVGWKEWIDANVATNGVCGGPSVVSTTKSTPDGNLVGFTYRQMEPIFRSLTQQRNPNLVSHACWIFESAASPGILNHAQFCSSLSRLGWQLR